MEVQSALEYMSLWRRGAFMEQITAYFHKLHRQTHKIITYISKQGMLQTRAPRLSLPPLSSELPDHRESTGA